LRCFDRAASIIEMTVKVTTTAIARPTIKRIFISFHHISLCTRCAERRKACAAIARLSVLDSKDSKVSPRAAALRRFSLIMPTASSTCACTAAIEVELGPGPPGFDELKAAGFFEGFVGFVGTGPKGVWVGGS